MKDGSGLARLIPPISESYISENKYNLPCIVKYGQQGEIVVDGITYDQVMEGFSHLTDAEISNVVNYILYRWAPDEGPLLPDEVSRTLRSCTEETK